MDIKNRWFRLLFLFLSFKFFCVSLLFFFFSLQLLLVFPILKSFFYHWKCPLPYFVPPSPDYLVIYQKAQLTDLVLLALHW